MKKLYILLIILIPICATAQIYDVLTYHENNSTGNGLLIRTEIPISLDQMPTIHIEGYDFGINTTISIDIAWLLAGGNLISASASSSGGLTPTIVLSSENDKVTIHLQHDFYYPRFKITAFAEGLDEDSSWFSGWTVTDESPGGSTLGEVLYNNQFKDYVTINGALTTDQIICYGNTYSTRFSGGPYTATGSNHFSQNAYLYSGSTWKSYGGKSNYGSAVILQTEGLAGKALNILVDSTIAGGSETLSFTNLFTINTDGKTGIGSTNPKELLQVNGNIVTSGNNKGYRFNSYYNSGNKYLSSGYASAFTLDSTGKLYYANTSSSGSADGAATLTNVFAIDKNGVVTAKKIKVTLTGWPDYVFEPGYKLPDLKEVERFIQLNKHLPGVPTAKEVEKNGNDVGETQSILLKKVEELTLYIIEQNKSIIKQTKSIEQQNKKIKKMEKQISQLKK